MKWLRKATRDEFVKSLTDLKEDKFAKTFVAKCDMMEAWDQCRAIWVGDKLAGAIVVTISKREPKTANLQLLHTFHEFRGKGIGKELCEWAVGHAYENGAEYFRVSAELDAVPFYKKIGFDFICRQKTAQLAMFRLSNETICKNDMLAIDDYIWKTMNKKGKGGCIECYIKFNGVENFLS